MNCNCRKELEAKLTENFVKEAPEATGHKAKLQGYGLTFGVLVNERSMSQVQQTALYPLKKGGTKERTTTVNMLHSYCPFCGVKQGGDAT